MENQRESTRVLETLIYSCISESIELFVIYSNIRVTQNHQQSLQIIKNYPILSDPFESEQPLASNRCLKGSSKHFQTKNVVRSTKHFSARIKLKNSIGLNHPNSFLSVAGRDSSRRVYRCSLVRFEPCDNPMGKGPVNNLCRRELPSPRKK